MDVVSRCILLHACMQINVLGIRPRNIADLLGNYQHSIVKYAILCKDVSETWQIFAYLKTKLKIWDRRNESKSLQT